MGQSGAETGVPAMLAGIALAAAGVHNFLFPGDPMIWGLKWWAVGLGTYFYMMGSNQLEKRSMNPFVELAVAGGVTFGAARLFHWIHIATS